MYPIEWFEGAQAAGTTNLLRIAFFFTWTMHLRLCHLLPLQNVHTEHRHKLLVTFSCWDLMVLCPVVPTLPKQQTTPEQVHVPVLCTRNCRFVVFFCLLPITFQSCKLSSQEKNFVHKVHISTFAHPGSNRIDFCPCFSLPTKSSPVVLPSGRSVLEQKCTRRL